MSNIFNIKIADSPADLLTVEIGADVIERCEGNPSDAIRVCPTHSAEIILAAVLSAIQRGDSIRNIEKEVVSMAVAFEEMAEL